MNQAEHINIERKLYVPVVILWTQDNAKVHVMINGKNVFD